MALLLQSNTLPMSTCVSQASMCQPDYVDDGGLLVVTTELFISRVDNTNLGEYGFVPFAEIIEGFEGMMRIYMQCTDESVE